MRLQLSLSVSELHGWFDVLVFVSFYVLRSVCISPYLFFGLSVKFNNNKKINNMIVQFYSYIFMSFFPGKSVDLCDASSYSQFLLSLSRRKRLCRLLCLLPVAGWLTDKRPVIYDLTSWRRTVQNHVGIRDEILRRRHRCSGEGEIGKREQNERRRTLTPCATFDAAIMLQQRPKIRNWHSITLLHDCIAFVAFYYALFYWFLVCLLFIFSDF